MLINKHQEKTPDEKKLRNINFLYFLLISFIVAWFVGVYIYSNQKTQTLVNPPVIVFDAADGMTLSNMFQVASNNIQITSATGKVKELYEVRDKYSFGDIVIVKFFYVEAVVIEKSSTSDQYTVLYKDHSHILQKVTLPRQMLLYPKEGVLNPASMLVD